MCKPISFFDAAFVANCREEVHEKDAVAGERKGRPYVDLPSHFGFCSDLQRVIDLSDPKVREQFLMSQLEVANQKMLEGWYS